MQRCVTEQALKSRLRSLKARLYSSWPNTCQQQFRSFSTNLEKKEHWSCEELKCPEQSFLEWERVCSKVIFLWVFSIFRCSISQHEQQNCHYTPECDSHCLIRSIRTKGHTFRTPIHNILKEDGRHIQTTMKKCNRFQKGKYGKIWYFNINSVNCISSKLLWTQGGLWWRGQNATLHVS